MIGIRQDGDEDAVAYDTADHWLCCITILLLSDLAEYRYWYYSY